MKMIVEFEVPVGRDAYRPKTAVLPWRDYAIHAMLRRLKKQGGMADRFMHVSNIKFEWGDRFYLITGREED